MAAAEEGRAYLAMMMLKSLMKRNMHAAAAAVPSIYAYIYLERGVVHDTEV